MQALSKHGQLRIATALTQLGPPWALSHTFDLHAFLPQWTALWLIQTWSCPSLPSLSHPYIQSLNPNNPLMLIAWIYSILSITAPPGSQNLTTEFPKQSPNWSPDSSVTLSHSILHTVALWSFWAVKGIPLFKTSHLVPPLKSSLACVHSPPNLLWGLPSHHHMSLS